MHSTEFRFPRTHRLLCRPDFQKVFANSQRFSDRYFLLHVKRNHLPHARLGFAISRKQIRKAVGRNRLKRFIRENFRLKQHNLLPLDLIVIARAKAASASNLELRISIENHWKKINRNVCDFPSKD